MYLRTVPLSYTWKASNNADVEIDLYQQTFKSSFERFPEAFEISTQCHEEEYTIYFQRQRFPVGSGLEIAIRVLRLTIESQLIWIDIDTNQSNNVEKEYSVLFMHRNYRYADKVLI